jgi:hypothetical protein
MDKRGIFDGVDRRHRERGRDLPGYAPSLSKVRRLKLKLVRDRLTRINHRSSAVKVGPASLKNVGNRVCGQCYLTFAQNTTSLSAYIMGISYDCMEVLD